MLPRKKIEGFACTPETGRQILGRTIGKLTKFAEHSVDVTRSRVRRRENVCRLARTRCRTRDERATAIQTTRGVQVPCRRPCLLSTNRCQPVIGRRRRPITGSAKRVTVSNENDVQHNRENLHRSKKAVSTRRRAAARNMANRRGALARRDQYQRVTVERARAVLVP
jgi:hypothetical protein